MKWKRNNIVIEEPIEEYLKKMFEDIISKGISFKVSIGTDSQKNGIIHKFATVILISTSENLGGGVIVGRGGKVIHSTYTHQFKSRDKELVSERMIFEVGKSIEVAYELSPLLESYGFNVEIHADINPNPKHDSNKALQQAVGYILGMGYDFKIKPEAPASSNCADRFC
jgi:predicted RNase H-related nuclease YkuK (DUF458 family)